MITAVADRYRASDRRLQAIIRDRIVDMIAIRDEVDSLFEAMLTSPDFHCLIHRGAMAATCPACATEVCRRRV